MDPAEIVSISGENALEMTRMLGWDAHTLYFRF